MEKFELKVSPNIILQILMKMKAVELTRAMRTCKKIRDVAENGRKQIQVSLNFENGFVFRMRLRIENEHPEEEPNLFLLHLNVAKTRKNDRFIAGVEWNFICSNIQLKQHLNNMGLGFFRFFELTLLANRLGKNQLMAVPVIQTLKANHITCYKLEAPTCDWIPCAVESLCPSKWSVYNIFSNSSLQNCLPSRLEKLKISVCLKPEDVDDLFFLLQKSSILSAYIDAEPPDFFPRLGEHFDRIRRGLQHSQRVKIRSYDHKKYKLEDHFPFTFQHFQRLSFAFVGKTSSLDRQYPDIFTVATGYASFLVIVSYFGSNQLPEQFRYIQFATVANWNELVDFLKGIFRTNNQQEN